MMSFLYDNPEKAQLQDRGAACCGFPSSSDHRLLFLTCKSPVPELMPELMHQQPANGPNPRHNKAHGQQRNGVAASRVGDVPRR